MRGELAANLGVCGDADVKQEEDGSEANKAARHACKALRSSLKKVDKPLKSLTAMKRTFAARAQVEDDVDVKQWQEESAQLNKVCEALEQYHNDCEHVACCTEHLLKQGVDKNMEDKEEAVAKFEEACKIRAKQCDSFRLGADTHIQNATEKSAEMKFKLTSDPSEWDS